MNPFFSRAATPAAYEDHVKRLCQRYESIAGRLGYEAIVVGSGALEYRFLDDQSHPFTASAHFLQWIPLLEHPGSAVIFRPGRKPVLIVYQPADYWYQPPPLPPEDISKHFELRIIRNTQDIAGELPPDSRHLALLGPEAQWQGLAADAVRNPPALVNALHYHRATKSPWEIACMREAAVMAAKGHVTAEEAFRAGGSEYDILAAFLAGCRQTEPELPYGAIVALNEHGATLHYQHRDRGTGKQDACHSLLIDAGCAFNGYASDITRSHAFHAGEFATMIADMDELQRELCAAVQPGIAFAELHREAHLGIAGLLEHWGLVKMAPPEMVREGISAAFFPHGLGHLLGLQVHDVGGHMADESGALLSPPEDFPRLRFLRSLEPGQVLTIEPGIYFIASLLEPLRTGQHSSRIDWQRLAQLEKYGGIRIEDDILVTADGMENLSRPHLEGVADGTTTAPQAPETAAGENMQARKHATDSAIIR